ncbi:MAG: leucine-rich repeat domain-containing protein [Prevotella sp.]|nr:leucine-rich repeat domain-containing protein [Prevotella sp.]
MKKTLFALFALCMLMATKAFAYEWTDGNGVKWTFNQYTFYINGESQKMWNIQKAEGYGESITVPQTVYNGSEACTIEAISLFAYDHFFAKCTSITLPATIKRISNSYGMTGQGTVIINAPTPPILDFNGHSFSADFTFVVPAASVEAYREADGWKENALRIISQSVKKEYSITAIAQSNGSGVHQVIGEENLGNVMSLTIKGSINSYDFMIMRNKMYNLHYLDLTDCSIEANSYNFYENYTTQKDVFPQYGFGDIDRLINVKLPKTILSIGTSAFFDCDGIRTVEFQEGLETIGTNAFNGCANLQEVHLKKGLKKVGKGAFSGGIAGNTASSYCYNLKSVSMETCEDIDDGAFSGAAISELTLPKDLKRIGEHAFAGGSITSLVLPQSVETIGPDAFTKCRELKSVEIKSCRSLGSWAFMSCTALESVILPEGLTEIPWCCFNDCKSLKSIILPSTIKSLGGRTFVDCTSLETISLPARLETIPECDFEGCTSLKSIHLPSSIRTIGRGAFSGCTSLNDYYVYTIEPTSITTSTFSNWESATLHVPSMAYNNYYWNTEWSNFAHVVEDNDYTYEYFYLNQDYIFTDALGTMSTTPDVDLNAGSGLVVQTKNTVNLKAIHFVNNSTASASIVANNNLSVQKLYFDIAVTKNKWYFLTFPFRVKLAKVNSPGDFVFRYYDGATRAQNGKGGWKNVETAYLNPGQGYIFQTNADGTLTLEVEKADMDFSGAGKQDALATYAATSTANASWNFLGNPHTSYFDINQTGYTAPITVWNGSAYQAIRPGDDTYFLKPFEAFFVQKPEGTAAVSFPATGRYTYQQTQSLAASARSEAPANTGRYLVNLTIATSDNAAVDKTRVVYNEQKTTGYEIDCDAAKFFSDGVAAQLYTLDHEGTQYAINERPLGEVAVGYVAAEKGLMTISAERMERPVLLRDNVMGITHDLSQGGYTFQTNAGTNESRFTLTFATTGISDAERLNDKVEMTNDKLVYDLQGRPVGNGQLKKGGYIVKDGKNTKKIIMK